MLSQSRERSGNSVFVLNADGLVVGWTINLRAFMEKLSLTYLVLPSVEVFQSRDSKQRKFKLEFKLEFDTYAIKGQDACFQRPLSIPRILKSCFSL